MPAISLGVTEIVARLRHVQRRWNGVALQHAVYVSGSLIALGAAALIVLALRGPPATFSATFWLAGAALVGGVLVIGRRLQQKWLTLEGVARRLDRTAGLDERLSTVVGCGARLEQSPLAGTLVRQLIDLAPRWTPAQVAPRRVPRSIWPFLVSLVVLAATAFLERRPPLQSPPAGTRATAHPAAGGERKASTEEMRAMPDNVIAAARTNAGAEDADPATVPALAAGRGNGAKDGKKNSPGQPDGIKESSIPGMEMIPGAGSRGEHGDAKPDGVPERLQDMIREAFGAKMLDKPQQVAKASAGRRAQPGVRPDMKSEGEQDSAEQGPGQSANNAGKEPRPDGRTDNQQQSESKPEGGNQAGNSDRPGGGRGAAGGLFGAQGTGEHGGGEPKTFQLKLSSFGNSFRLDTEPQTKKHDENVPTTSDTARKGGQESPLNQQQSADDPLQKGAIPPEHETTVRQIFSLRE